MVVGCFTIGCSMRDMETGMWSGAFEACNPANGGCDPCFPDSPCLVGQSDDGDDNEEGSGGDVVPDTADYSGVVISEVSSNPVTGVCEGHDYIEIHK